MVPGIAPRPRLSQPLMSVTNKAVRPHQVKIRLFWGLAILIELNCQLFQKLVSCIVGLSLTGQSAADLRMNIKRSWFGPWLILVCRLVTADHHSSIPYRGTSFLCAPFTSSF